MTTQNQVSTTNYDTLDREMVEYLKSWAESDEKYPVEFDKSWPWLGYSRKDVAKRALEAQFTKDEHYKLYEQQKSTGGRRLHLIMLSKSCFKLFCLLSKTKKARNIHEYYMSIETAYTQEHPESVLTYDNDNLHKAFHEPFSSNHNLHMVPTCEDSLEKRVADELAQQLGGEREIVLECGRVDVRTNSSVIEVKMSNKWKHALGQVLAYAYETNLEPRIHLIGCVPDVAHKICKHFGVSISSETRE